MFQMLIKIVHCNNFACNERFFIYTESPTRSNHRITIEANRHLLAYDALPEGEVQFSGEDEGDSGVGIY